MIPDEYPTDTHRVSQEKEKKKRKKKKEKKHERDYGLYVHNRYSGMSSRTCHFLIGPEEVSYNT
jgi:hypothetical protein